MPILWGVLHWWIRATRGFPHPSRRHVRRNPHTAGPSQTSSGQWHNEGVPFLRVLLTGALTASAACAATTPAPAPELAAAAPARPVRVQHLPQLEAPVAMIHRAVAPSFSVPIPEGFVPYRDEAREPVYTGGGVILSQAVPPDVKDPYQANILVTPLPDQGLDLSDATLCFALSEGAAQSLSGSVVGVRKVKRKNGPTCQVLVKPSTEVHKRSRAEVVGDTERVWMVTCNYDHRDTQAPKSCDAVVEGFTALGKKPSLGGPVAARSRSRR